MSSCPHKCQYGVSFCKINKEPWTVPLLGYWTSLPLLASPCYSCASERCGSLDVFQNSGARAKAGIRRQSLSNAGEEWWQVAGLENPAGRPSRAVLAALLREQLPRSAICLPRLRASGRPVSQVQLDLNNFKVFHRMRCCVLRD